MLNECVSKWRETRVRLLVHTCDAPLRVERAGELTEPKKTAHSTRISPPFLAFVKVKRSAGFAGAEGAHLVPATAEQALGDGCKKSAGFATKCLQVLQVQKVPTFCFLRLNRRWKTAAKGLQVSLHKVCRFCRFRRSPPFASPG